MVLIFKKRHTAVLLSFIFATLCVFCENSSCKSAEAGERANGKTVKAHYGSQEEQVARSFLERLSQIPPGRIETMGLVYAIHLECQWGINMKMMIRVSMKRAQNRYISTFKLTEPKGENLWGKFALFVLGRHTKEYKKLVEGIESTMYETFHFEDGKFMTDELTEILPKREKFKGKKGFRVFFDYNEKRIKFWKDSSRVETTASQPYTNQVGPLTAFFNYLLYYQPETEISIINQQQHVITSSMEKRAPEKGTVGTFFGSQVIRINRNNTNKHTGYASTVCFESEGFFDIVYGKNIYYNLSQINAGNLKAPYAAFLDGVISRSKKRKKAEKLEDLQKQGLAPKLYDKKRQEIESMDILAAKNVRIRLRQADVVF